MSNITIGRYDDISITKDYAGWIEPADKSWIIYTDTAGIPCLYFADRDSTGAVIGEGIAL